MIVILPTQAFIQWMLFKLRRMFKVDSSENRLCAYHSYPYTGNVY